MLILFFQYSKSCNFTADVDFPKLPLPKYIFIDEVCLTIASNEKIRFCHS